MLCNATAASASLAAPAQETENAPSSEVAPSAAVERGFAVALSGGYAFRSQFDNRNHGLAAALSLETPTFGPLTVRADALTLQIFGSDADEPSENPRDLALNGGAVSINYLFDDADVQARVGVGPIGLLSSDGDVRAFGAGALVSLTLTTDLLSEVFDGLLFGLAPELRLVLPVPLWLDGKFLAPAAQVDDDGVPITWPLQVAFMLGVRFEPFSWLRAASSGGSTETPRDAGSTQVTSGLASSAWRHH